MSSPTELTELDELTKQKDLLTDQIRLSTNNSEKKKLLIDECKKISQKIKELHPNQKNQDKQNNKQNNNQQKKQNLVTAECAHCDSEYQTSGKSRVPIAYCKECRKQRQDDILEFIIGDSFSIYAIEQLDDAEKLLKTLKSDLRLDLHKTLDTISSNTKLPVKNACCVSYVGCLTVTRLDAREEIMERIKNNQIQFGVLVFKRGSPKNENRNSFTEIGSKYWFNSLVRSDTKISMFIDDSEDHVLSVGCIDNIKSIQIKPREHLLNLIKNNK